MHNSQQYGNTVVVSGSAAVIVDQWYIFFTSTGVASVAQHLLTTPRGSLHRLRFVIVTPDATLDAPDYLSMQHRIEGVRCAELKFGSAAAQQIILRFGFRAPAGTYSIFVKNHSTVRSYVANFTISAGQANTDTEQTFVIPGDTTGTWPIDSANIGLQFGVALAAGSNVQGVAGWQANSRNGTASNSNGLATSAATYDLFDVGLYMDPYKTGVAPAWELPDFAQELRRCQRYWYRQYTLRGGHGDTASMYRGGAQHAAPMRVPPAGSIVGTPKIYDAGVTPTATSMSAQGNEYVCEFDVSCSAGGFTPGRVGIQYYQTEASYFAISARH
jgi:hypothetical protein